ncbi:MAG TPA: hypothetical protein VHK88_07760, partial [Aquihabitans sp.]|nr:hypothetical protein [Aquihabitans sp.]
MIGTGRRVSAHPVPPAPERVADDREVPSPSAFDATPAPSTGDARAPVTILASTFVLALVLRAVHALATDPVLSSVGDNTAFRETARSVATGNWGRLPTMDGSEAISVKFPPLWPWTLGAGQRVLWFLDPDTANGVWSVLLGAAVAPLAGLLAWRLLDRLPLGSRRLIAGGIAVVAAVHPLLIGATNSLMSEVVVVPISLGVLLLADRVHRRGPTARSLVALG